MFYRVARAAARGVLTVLRRWEIQGEENIPASGGVVVISNHISYWDPVVIGCVLPRRINFIAKAELFNIPVFGRIITRLGAFPVRRDNPNPAAIRRALELLKAGEMIGIFPEGTRSRTNELMAPHQGAAMLALKGGVPILPIAVSGTRGVFGKVRVNIGEPMEFASMYRKKLIKTELEKVSRETMAEIGRLLAIIDKGR